MTMQTTEDIAAAVASASSKSVQSRRTLYVGGLDDAVTQSLLHASFIPFGPIKSVELVQDYSNNRRKYNPNNSKRGGRGGPSFGNTNTYRGKFSSSIPTAPAHKGFGFVEFEDADDAAEAMYNMDGAELLGRTLNVTVAQKSSNQHRLGSNKPIWSSDQWLRDQVAGNDEKTMKTTEEKQAIEASALK